MGLGGQYPRGNAPFLGPPSFQHPGRGQYAQGPPTSQNGQFGPPSNGARGQPSFGNNNNVGSYGPPSGSNKNYGPPSGGFQPNAMNAPPQGFASHGPPSANGMQPAPNSTPKFTPGPPFHQTSMAPPTGPQQTGPPVGNMQPRGAFIPGQHMQPPPVAQQLPQGGPRPVQQGFMQQNGPPQAGFGQAGFPPQNQPQQGYPHQGPPQPGYPHQNPPQSGYPPQNAAQPGFPPQNAAQPGFPPQNPGQPGFPQQNQPGFPPQNQQYPARNPVQQPQTPAQRIDPTQIPRPHVSPDTITYVAKGHTMTMPPPATSLYVCVDEGCCNPRFIRPTLNHVPESNDLLKQCGIPLSAVICPLAPLAPGENQLPVVDFGPTGPLRCTRCRAYVNSFTKFIQAGRKFVCNICTLHNETPREYYCSVDQMGRRRDVMERAELARGSVEFVVPQGYAVRPPQEPIVVFVLDVSLFSFQSGLVQGVLNAIQEVVPRLALNPRAKFGLVTFDTAVHYYRMDKESSISMCVCPDVDDPAAPLPFDSWCLPLNAPNCMDKITELSELITTLFSETNKNQAVSGSALTSVIDTLSTSGGRICVFHAGPPRVGVGKITKEEPASHYGTTKEVELYTRSPKLNPHYEELARKCALHYVTVDVISAANPFSDLADVARVCELTGGRAYYLPQFEKDKSEHIDYLGRLLSQQLTKNVGFEAVLKIRVSAGLRVDTLYGAFATTSEDEMNFSSIDANHAIGVSFAYDDRLDGEVYIQAALLYTRLDGARVVRVHNLALPVANLVTNVFRNADLDATCAIWQRMSAKVITDRSIMGRANGQAVKERLVDDCVNVLFNYRKHCASNSSSGQLILPESLKLLPLYTLASLKSRGLRTNIMGNPPRGFIDVRADERVCLLAHFNSLPVEAAVSAVYPKMYPLHDMPEDCGTLDDKGNMVLPAPLPPTAEKLEEYGIFLLHSATFMYMFVGAKVSSHILLELFGMEHVDTAEQPVNLVDEASDAGPLREQVRAIVRHLQSQIPVMQPLEIMTKTDWRSVRFMSALVEDRTKNEVSYVEFLCQVHKKIQYKFM
ncbi:transporter Sec24 [Thraustotheca clavata]|uniref:Transporter Sec24 n=1 Tax=Thraustotheca clavata TaxID=74557 RepID=A0A1V9ZF89_9STRA|nr:transporter Sec24 [Thraustotheca clavata]